MSSLRTLICALIVVAAGPDARASQQLAQEFAACTGQLSAALEHQWLLSDPGAEATERQRDAMADLLDAMTSAEGSVPLMAIRVDAKHALKALLSRATFNADPRDAAWARQSARARIDACTAHLLM